MHYLCTILCFKKKKKVAGKYKSEKKNKVKYIFVLNNAVLVSDVSQSDSVI